MSSARPVCSLWSNDKPARPGASVRGSSEIAIISGCRPVGRRSRCRLGRRLGRLGDFRRFHRRAECAHVLPPRDLLFAEPIETGHVTTCFGHTILLLLYRGPRRGARWGLGTLAVKRADGSATPAPPTKHRRGLVMFYAKLTCSACRPLGPRVTTNDTF